MASTIKHNGRWFRFSLGTMLVAITLLAVGLGWLAYHVNWIRQRHLQSASLAERWKQFDILGPLPDQPSGRHTARMPFGLWLLGEPERTSVMLIRSTGHDDTRRNPARDDEDEVRRARGLFPEADIHVARITEQGDSVSASFLW